jgi:hypothetical protein
METSNTITWRRLVFRITILFVIFVIASDLFFPFPTGQNWTIAQKATLTLGAYLANFLVILGLVSLVALLIAKVPSANRNKPLPNFINSGLIATALLACLFLYGGWYGSQKAGVSATQPHPHAGSLGVSNYWECILKEMPGTKDDRIAAEVMKMCRKQFPKTSVVEKKSHIGTKTSGQCAIEYGKDVASPNGVKSIYYACNRLYPMK